MPSKAFLHEEDIPKNQRMDVPETQIHDVFLEFADQKNLNVIDFQKYFLENQNNIPYPIFPKHGIHISEYAETIVMDSLMKYVENIQSKDLYDHSITDPIETTIPQRRDEDIAVALNLKTPLVNDETLAYTKIKLVRRDRENEPRVLVIGDSFYWGLYPRVKGHGLFKRYEFWYRNHQVFPSPKNKKQFSSQAKCLESLKGFDITFVMATSNAMDYAGWGYFDTLHKLRTKDFVAPDSLLAIYKVVDRIKANNVLLESVKMKALERNISLDSMLFLDAKWIYERR